MKAMLETPIMTAMPRPWGLRQACQRSRRSVQESAAWGEAGTAADTRRKAIPISAAGSAEISMAVRQSTYTSRKPTASGASTSAKEPPMAWMPSAWARRAGRAWASTPVAIGCQAASPRPASASSRATLQKPGASEATA